MSVTETPIRYPGGKTKLYSFVREILQRNNLLEGTYCEPFAGGAGLAFKLLFNHDVNRIIINDADPAIYALWSVIIFNPQVLCDFIRTVDITMAEWNYQKKIYLSADQHSKEELAKATLFLNRTNVSGILTGGVIGGREQKGAYKMDARFNRKNLIHKIEKISSVSEKIDLHNLDILDFIRDVIPMIEDKSLINFDPPYVNQGGQLYKNAFSIDDHKQLRDQISQCNKKWIVTYDVCPLIKSLYSGFRGQLIDINYSANSNRKAQEYVFFSNDLIL